MGLRAAAGLDAGASVGAAELLLSKSKFHGLDSVVASSLLFWSEGVDLFFSLGGLILTVCVTALVLSGREGAGRLAGTEKRINLIPRATPVNLRNPTSFPRDPPLALDLQFFLT